MTHTGSTPDDAAATDTREEFGFRRLTLPPVPTFELPVPTSDWRSPFLAPDPEVEYRAMVAAAAEAVAEQPAPAPVPAPAPAPVPVMAPAPEAPQPAATSIRESLGITAEPAAPTVQPLERSSVVGIGVVLLCTVLLAWASRMAFSAALLAMAGLLLAQLAAAASAARAGRLPLLAGGGAIAAALLATKGALGQFGEMAFVAGLFVIVAVVPTLLLMGSVQLILRRRGARATAADAVLRTSWKQRFGALLALLLAGVQAHRTFSAVPDAIVTFGIVALIALTLTPVLRATREPGA